MQGQDPGLETSRKLYWELRHRVRGVLLPSSKEQRRERGERAEKGVESWGTCPDPDDTAGS